MFLVCLRRGISSNENIRSCVRLPRHTVCHSLWFLSFLSNLFAFAMNRTLSILKPDVVLRGITGKVNAYIEDAGLKIIAMKQIHLTEAQAKAFYAVHSDRSFFDDLVEFMTSAPVVVQVLSGDDAVRRYRQLMGETDPKDALRGTIRGDFAKSIDANCVHGSDSDENAIKEIAFFFSQCEIHER